VPLYSAYEILLLHGVNFNGSFFLYFPPIISYQYIGFNKVSQYETLHNSEIIQVLANQITEEEQKGTY
jgi:hypothetical protein